MEAMFSFLLHPEQRDDKLQPCSFKYFYKTFPKKLAQKLRTKLRIDTEGQSPIVFLIITFYHKLFLTKYAANLLLITQHYLLFGFSAIRQLCFSLTHLISFDVVYVSFMPSSHLFLIKTFLALLNNQSFSCFHAIFVIFNDSTH